MKQRAAFLPDVMIILLFFIRYSRSYTGVSTVLFMYGYTVQGWPDYMHSVILSVLVYSTGLTILHAFSNSLCTSIQYRVNHITCIQYFFMYKYTVQG